jgi:hypothetical protein
MDKIVIDYIYKNYFNARSKAREDVNYIAGRCGYRMLFIETRTTTEAFAGRKASFFARLNHNINKVFLIFKGLRSIPKRSKVLLQYPFAPLGDMFTSFLCKRIKAKSCELTIIVHDIVSYRETGKFGEAEIKILNQADTLIIHTPKMALLFDEVGIRPEKKLLHLFDYISKEQPNVPEQNPKTVIAFAGNLEKSLFLNSLDSIGFTNLLFRLYGIGGEKYNIKDRIEYVGRFSPDNISYIHADWGLVWDGTSVEKCDGLLGNYQKINSPHKTSLYIAAGIPVIVWKEAATAPFIEENKLGIAVGSMYEIESAITSLTSRQIAEIKDNVMLFSEKLREGGMLGQLIL